MAFKRRSRAKRKPRPRATPAPKPLNLDDGSVTGRKLITEKLYQAVTFYWAKKTYSVHKEVGVERWGRRRLDVMAMDFVGNMVGLEIKSCLADFRTDKKWREYLSHTTQLYFVFPPSIMKSRCFPEIKEELKAEGAGILTLSETTGLIRCAMKAKRRPMSIVSKHQVYKKLAWRGGESKRTITQTQRVYL